MFLHWEGFEIDGSDTDFDILLPETRQREDFIRCFLDAPLFRRSPMRAYYIEKVSDAYQERELDEKELFELLLSPEHPQIRIEINCLTTDELPKQIVEQLYALSRTRDPHEEAYGKSISPCMAPIQQSYFDRGAASVCLAIYEKNGPNHPWFEHDLSPVSGYIRNERQLYDPTSGSWFTINVGPGFFYEYAMFLIGYVEQHFPEIAIAGGLDCQGGWTGGCTYSDSIYAYEKIQLPIKYSIPHTLKRLRAYGLLQSYDRQYQSKQREWAYTAKRELDLIQLPDGEPWEYDKKHALSFEDYIAHAERVLGNQTEVFTSLCRTAVQIMPPLPDRFEKIPDVAEKLKTLFPNYDAHTNPYLVFGYFSLAMIDGQAVAEFRIPRTSRDYFLTLLDLMDSGLLETFKKENYDNRNS